MVLITILFTIIISLIEAFERVDVRQKNLELFHFGKHCKIQKASDKLGIPSEAFDKILVSASAKKIPKELFL